MQEVNSNLAVLNLGLSIYTTSVITLLHHVTGCPCAKRRATIKLALPVCFFLGLNASGNSHSLFVTIFPNKNYILDNICGIQNSRGAAREKPRNEHVKLQDLPHKAYLELQINLHSLTRTSRPAAKSIRNYFDNVTLRLKPKFQTTKERRSTKENLFTPFAGNILKYDIVEVVTNFFNNPHKFVKFAAGFIGDALKSPDFAVILSA